MAENEPNDLMSEFRKLQKETVGIRSVFAETLPFNSTKMMEHKLIKDLQSICEKAMKRHDDQDEVNKKLIEKLCRFREDASETKRNQEASMNKILAEFQSMRKQLEEAKKNQLVQNQAMKRQDDQDKTIKQMFGELCQIRNEVSETKTIQRNQEQMLIKVFAELQSVRNELAEIKKKQLVQDETMRNVQNELQNSSYFHETLNEPNTSEAVVMNSAKLQSIQKELQETKKNQLLHDRSMKRPLHGLQFSSENKKVKKDSEKSVIPTSSYDSTNLECSYDIFVRTRGTTITVFKVFASTTIKNLKIAIEKSTKISSSDMHLYFNELEVFYDHRTLLEYNIGPGSIIQAYSWPSH